MAGALVMALGSMIFLLTGLCTFTLMGTVFVDHLQHGRGGSYDDAAFILAPVVGGIPMAAGASIMLHGFAFYRRAVPGAASSLEDRQRRYKQTQSLATGVLLVGIGVPFLWLSGFSLVSYIHGLLHPGFGTSGLGLGIVALALGGPPLWFGISCFRRGLRRGS